MQMGRDWRGIQLGIALSVLVHLLLLTWLRIPATAPNTGTVRSFTVSFSMLSPAPPASQPLPTPAKPLSRAVRLRASTSTPARQTAAMPAAAPVLAEPAPAPDASDQPAESPSLTERALGAVRGVERSLRQETEAGRQLLPAKPQHRNLLKLPAPLQTALAKSFTRELEEMAVLDVQESQEGGDRITRIYTNKGLYCVRTPLLRSPAMRGVPLVPMFGGCGP